MQRWALLYPSGLENRRPFTQSVGSNPTPSATYALALPGSVLKMSFPLVQYDHRLNKISGFRRLLSQSRASPASVGRTVPPTPSNAERGARFMAIEDAVAEFVEHHAPP